MCRDERSRLAAINGQNMGQILTVARKASNLPAASVPQQPASEPVQVRPYHPHNLERPLGTYWSERGDE